MDHHVVLEKDKRERLWFGDDNPWAATVGSCSSPARSPLFCLRLLHTVFLAAPFLSPVPYLTSLLVLWCLHGQPVQ